MAECGKKDTCKNYDKKCSECWAMSSIYDTHPCYTSKDLVEVVRCKDCNFARKMVNGDYYCLVDHRISHEENDFCSYGTPQKEG